MKLKKLGGPEVLEIRDIKIEDPKNGEVLIKHSAIGLNYIDTYHRSGLYPLPLPSGIGLEASGVIEKIGNNVGDFKEGDKAKLLVCAHTHDTILCFSTKGKAFSIRVFDIPDTSRQARGKSINNIIPLESDESISAILAIKNFDEDSYLFLTTKKWHG